MRMCEIPKADILPTPVHLTIKEELDFLKAERVAKDQARSYYGDAMLLSWFDKKTGRYSPHDVDCCSDRKAELGRIRQIARRKPYDRYQQ